MPRLTKNLAQRQRDAVVRAIDAYLAECKRAGRDYPSTANALGVPYATLRRRTKSPENFTLGELQSIANTLNITIASLLGCTPGANPALSENEKGV